MGQVKKTIEEPTDVCEDCGAPLECNDDGEVECTADESCLRQVIASERSRKEPAVELFDAGMRKKMRKMKRDRAARRN